MTIIACFFIAFSLLVDFRQAGGSASGSYRQADVWQVK
jgi:hypothetical protein